MTEKEVARKMELYAKEKDADMSFPTIVAFGPHAAIPHHHTSDQRLKDHDCILLDFGVRYQEYCSDMTRTIFLGEPTDEQKNVYETVLAAQQKSVEYISKALASCHSEQSEESRDPSANRPLDNRPHAAIADRVARKYIESQGFASIPHSLGHGIGLEVHEAPSLSPSSEDTLVDGMVFSIEPGIYLNGKFGVRIEDLFTIQNGKLCQLTHSSSTLTQI